MARGRFWDHLFHASGPGLKLGLMAAYDLARQLGLAETMKDYRLTYREAIR